MTVIKLIAADQKLITVQNPIVASGNVESVVVEVEFDSVWSGYNISAIFYTLEDKKVYEKILIDNACKIPHEVMKTAGTLFIGMRGVMQDGTVKATHLLKYKIEEGAPEGTETSEPPSESVYMYLVGTVASMQEEMRAFIQSAEQEQSEFEAFMQRQQTTFETSVNSANTKFQNEQTQRQTTFETSVNQSIAGITPEKIGAANATHSQAASTITAGTFAGQVVANSGGQSPSVSLLRNSRFSFDENDVPTVEGETVWYLK